MAFAATLPLAFVMVAGPQILAPVFIAASPRWKSSSLAYIAGAALSIPILVSAGYLLGKGTRDRGGPAEIIYIAILVLLLLAMIRTWIRRKDMEPPRWMGKLIHAEPRPSFRLGFLLLGFFPTDIISSLTVGSYLATKGLPLWQAGPFLLLTLFMLAIPSLVLLSFGQKGELFLPRAREWMVEKAWVINEFVLGFFVLIVISDLVA